MIDDQNLHLTDEQFTDLLLGSTAPAVRAHLDACAQCSQEAEGVSAAIGNFEQQSRLWAERHAATSPLPTFDRPPAFAWLHRPQAWIAAAFAIVLATGVGVSVRRNHVQPTPQPIAHVLPVTPVSAATLKADNELLSAIDVELREDDSPNADMYGLRAITHAMHNKSPKRVSN